MLLSEIESKKLLMQAGIPVTETLLATTKDEAVSLSKKLGFPVALKIVSNKIAHKSDAGGVKLSLDSPEAVEKAYEEIEISFAEKHPDVKLDGISVQQMAKPGIEVIVGMNKDAQFGPVLMFGLGGVLVEIMKDVAFRVAPLTRKDASEMIKEIKGYPVLTGYRGQEPVDISCLEDILIKLSEFVERNDNLQEIDLNPIFVNKNGAIAVDARVVTEDS